PSMPARRRGWREAAGRRTLGASRSQAAASTARPRMVDRPIAGRIPCCMRVGRRVWRVLGWCALGLAVLPGCATMRRNAETADLRPCFDGYAYTRDGWKLGMRHVRPANPDPGKLPIVLCHGLG